jgi:hypothetical protein
MLSFDASRVSAPKPSTFGFRSEPRCNRQLQRQPAGRLGTQIDLLERAHSLQDSDSRMGLIEHFSYLQGLLGNTW